ncbi:MAG: hypothetical protein R2882_04840 [Gemmatimonadales bacterium]
MSPSDPDRKRRWSWAEFVNRIGDFIYTVPTGETDPASGFEIDVTQGDATLAGSGLPPASGIRQPGSTSTPPPTTPTARTRSPATRFR